MYRQCPKKASTSRLEVTDSIEKPTKVLLENVWNSEQKQGVRAKSTHLYYLAKYSRVVYSSREHPVISYGEASKTGEAGSVSLR